MLTGGLVDLPEMNGGRQGHVMRGDGYIDLLAEPVQIGFNALGGV